jgi:hypothetical protein
LLSGQQSLVLRTPEDLGRPPDDAHGRRRVVGRVSQR